ncbi:MAG TPA: alpha/beta hydrolase [Luteibaculaceae bacterium]|nr:alpha/beta hydrolase [Luteibaculaceae bacterium]
MFLSTRNFNLSSGVFVRQWGDPGLDTAVVAVHGMGTHSGRFDKIGSWLAQNGVKSYCYDHPGHGLSPGKRGHIDSYEDLLQPLDELLDRVVAEVGADRVFLFGHSMGGNVALNYLLRRKPELAGAVISSPWLKLAFDPPFFKMMLAKWLVNVFPALKQESKLNVNYISHDREVLKNYDQDPLIHQQITLRFFLEVSKAGLYALDHASELHIPAFLFHGTDDHITSFEASQQLSTRSNNIQFKAWPGCYHEVHNEWVFDELMDQTLQFIHQQINLNLRQSG